MEDGIQFKSISNTILKTAPCQSLHIVSFIMRRKDMRRLPHREQITGDK
ncbi:hypothetical protein EDD64_1359 [Effusibacillus lacus]|nr:hypothetical protein EDD64_1359 [Effusibacillus lacus]